MEKALDRMVASLHAYDEDICETSGKRQIAMSELKSLKELLDIGAITQNEYDEKKKKLMSQF